MSQFPFFRFAVFLSFLVAGGALPGYAAEVEAAEEADEIEHGKINTPDPSPVDPGNAEFEVSYGYSQAKHLWDNDGNSHARGLTREHAASFALTVGIVDNLDAAIGGSHKWLKDKENDFDADDALLGPETGDGFGDLELAGRYRFWEDKTRAVELAYVGGFTAPTGTRSDNDGIGTTQDYWTFNQTLVGVKDWGKWTANADAGFALPFGNRKGSARGAFNADVAGGYQVLPWLQPELELNFSHAFVAEAGDARVLSVTGGLVMPVHERLRVNVGVQQGVWGKNADRSTSFVIAAKTAF